jgi:hypothetical protein
VRTDGGIVVAGDSHYDNKKTTMVGGGVGLVLGGIGFALAAPPAKMMALPMIPVVSEHTPSDTAAQSRHLSILHGHPPMHHQCNRICEAYPHL